MKSSYKDIEALILELHKDISDNFTVRALDNLGNYLKKNYRPPFFPIISSKPINFKNCGKDILIEKSLEHLRYIYFQSLADIDSFKMYQSFANVNITKEAQKDIKTYQRERALLISKFKQANLASKFFNDEKSKSSILPSDYPLFAPINDISSKDLKEFIALYDLMNHWLLYDKYRGSFEVEKYANNIKKGSGGINIIKNSEDKSYMNNLVGDYIKLFLAWGLELKHSARYIENLLWLTNVDSIFDSQNKIPLKTQKHKKGRNSKYIPSNKFIYDELRKYKKNNKIA